MPYKRRKYHRGEPHSKQFKTKRRTKDLDEIDHDLKHKAEELLDQKVDVEKAGNAQFYCIHCSRYFIDEHALTHHFKSKVHKRRMRELRLEPYSIEESERAAGLGGSYKAPEKRKIETLLPKSLAERIEVDAEQPDAKKVKTVC